MRDDGYDDEADPDDDDAPAGPVPFPGIVRAAGIIWICVGALELVNAALTLVLAGVNQNPGGASGVCCSGGVGIAFLMCGMQTVTGKAKDTLGNGIGSIALGVLLLGAGVLIGFGGAFLGANPGANQNGPPPELFIIIGAITAVLGLTLILAGTLALVGRSRYREWREARSPRSRRPRRRRVEDDEEDE